MAVHPLLNRRRVISSTGGSNPPLSARSETSSITVTSASSDANPAWPAAQFGDLWQIMPRRISHRRRPSGFGAQQNLGTDGSAHAALKNAPWDRFVWTEPQN